VVLVFTVGNLENLLRRRNICAARYGFSMSAVDVDQHGDLVLKEVMRLWSNFETVLAFSKKSSRAFCDGSF